MREAKRGQARPGGRALMIGLVLVTGVAISFAGRAIAQSLGSEPAKVVPVAPPSPSPSPAGVSISKGAALVRGTVIARKSAYDPVGGPRTEYTFKVEDVYEGSVPREQVVLSFLGGHLPDGRFLAVSDVPILADGRSYLALLAADSAFFSPVVPDFLFAIEDIEGKEVLIGEDGRGLAAITVLGPRFGEQPLFEEPRFDGQDFRSAVPLQTPVTERMLTVSNAVRAIRAIAAADQIQLGGPLADPRRGRGGRPWNEFRASGAVQ
jgi:hypothetical protein